MIETSPDALDPRVVAAARLPHPRPCAAIFTYVRDLRRAKSWRETVAMRLGDATVVMRASTLWVFVDLATRRPRRVPEDIASALDPLPSATSSEPAVPKMADDPLQRVPEAR